MCLTPANSSKPTENVRFAFNSQIKCTENELQRAVAAIAEYAYLPAAGCLPRIYFIPVSTEMYHLARSCLPRSYLRWKVFNESLPSKGRLLRFHDFIFQLKCHSIFTYQFITMRSLFVLFHCSLMVRFPAFFNFH
jgi:hypothetical protein